MLFFQQRFFWLIDTGWLIDGLLIHLVHSGMRFQTTRLICGGVGVASFYLSLSSLCIYKATLK